VAVKERGNKLLRALDRVIGIPLILFFSASRIVKLKSHHPIAIIDTNRIAIFKSAAIGDTVILSASIADIRCINPKAHLTIFTGSSNFEIARLIPGIDEVVILPVTRPLEAIKRLHDFAPFDVWVDFGSWPRLDALLSWFAPAKYKIGFKTAGQYRHYLYDLAIQHGDDLHELHNYRNLLKSLNVPGTNIPSLMIQHTEKNPNQGHVVLHLYPGGSKAHLKQWPEDKWIRLIEVLVSNGHEVFLTGGKNDYEKLFHIKQSSGNSDLIKVVAGNLNICETAALLEKSKLVISVDTGIMHMASALNCKLIALHGPTSPLRWGALNHNSISILKQLPCSPCISLGFESTCKNNFCMSAITVDDITSAIRKLQANNDNN